MTRRAIVRLLAIAALLWACCAQLPAFAAQTTIIVTADAPPTPPALTTGGTRTLSASAFLEELSPISKKLDDWADEDPEPKPNEVSELRARLPKMWQIETADGSFLISAAPLDQALQRAKFDDASAWAETVTSLLQSYLKPAPTGATDPRSQLQSILASSEFSAVHPKSAWDLFRERVSAWLQRLFGGLFAGLDRHPLVGNIVFWGILLLVVSLIARLLFQFLISRDRMEALPGQEIGTASRTWQEWIRLAREAAERQQYREAVHASYWAGIARLEDIAVLPKDCAHTPREYLRAVARMSQNELSARPTHYLEPLTGLTARLERVWYANRGAQARDFQDALAQLKDLGCPLD